MNLSELPTVATAAPNGGSPNGHFWNIPTTDAFFQQYGPYAFGVGVFMLISAVVWWMYLRPMQERGKRDDDGRLRQLDQIQRTAELNAATAANIAAAAASLAKLADDMKVISKMMDASLARSDRIMERLENMQNRMHSGASGGGQP